MFIIAPGLSPRVEHVLGSHLDIASTLTALLKVPEAKHWLGNSLFPTVKNRLVLYNDLTTLTRLDATLYAEKNYHYKKFIEYSKSILD